MADEICDALNDAVSLTVDSILILVRRSDSTRGLLPSNLVLSGYLLVHQIHHKNLTSIPLPNLRLIRGQRLYHHNPMPGNKNSSHNYSMVLFGGCTYCTSLGLNNLVGASTQYSSISIADLMDRNQEVSYFRITGPSQLDKYLLN